MDTGIGSIASNGTKGWNGGCDRTQLTGLGAIYSMQSVLL